MVWTISASTPVVSASTSMMPLSISTSNSTSCDFQNYVCVAIRGSCSLLVIQFMQPEAPSAGVIRTRPAHTCCASAALYRMGPGIGRWVGLNVAPLDEPLHERESVAQGGHGDVSMIFSALLRQRTFGC